MPIEPPPRFVNNAQILHGPKRRKPHQGVKEMQRRAKQLKRDKEKQGISMPTDLVK
jgi:hypothetical protein